MAWGYWSATSVNDRGRSPRREKDKTTLGPTYQQVQQPAPPAVAQAQQQVAEPQQPCTSSLQIQTDLEDAPCPRMMQTGSIYTFSGSTSTSGPGRRLGQDVPVSSILTRGPAFPPSPGESDSAEYEQPSCAHLGSSYHVQDCLVDPISSSSSRMKLFRPEDEEEDDDQDFSPDIYSPGLVRSLGLVQPGPSGCLIHGPCATVEPAPSIASSTNDEPIGGSQYWLNDITWGRSSNSWEDE